MVSFLNWTIILNNKMWVLLSKFKGRRYPNKIRKEFQWIPWMQEAYRPPCSEYSFCCPNWVPPILTWPGGAPCWGVPYLGTPVLTWWGGTLLRYPWQGNPWQGTPGRIPPSRVCPPAGYPLAGYPPGRVPPGRIPLAAYPHRVLLWRGTPQQGTPLQGTPMAGCPHPDLAGYPPQLDLAGVPPLGVCPMEFWVMLQGIMGYGYPSHPPHVCPMAFWVMLQSIMGYRYPP